MAKTTEIYADRIRMIWPKLFAGFGKLSADRQLVKIMNRVGYKPDGSLFPDTYRTGYLRLGSEREIYNFVLDHLNESILEDLLEHIRVKMATKTEIYDIGKEEISKWETTAVTLDDIEDIEKPSLPSKPKQKVAAPKSTSKKLPHWGTW